MSGHSKWHQIKFKKGIADAKKGKIFTKHAKLITIAVREGGADPSMNPTLRTLIANAKSDNMPNLNIDKAIKKGAGEGKEGANFSEVMYEGFGPEKVALYIQVITDNRNRASTNIRTIMAKNGGILGEAGTVGWMFEKKGLIIAKAKDANGEENELKIIDSGADDFSLLDDNEYEVKTEPSMLMKVRDNLEKAGFEINKAELTFLPKNTTKIEDKEKAKALFDLIEAVEDDDDVSAVYSNADIPDEIVEAF